jgi:HAE1 family hydrophobic/amphiphilic exporter-1
VNISELFIRRPVMTTLVMMGILLFGVLGYRLLPVSDLPNVDFPTINVSAGLPGASPETIASSVATPLERQFATIAGVDSISSVSTLGSTSITIQFSLSRNIDAAAQDVQAAITAAAPQLPPNMPSPPTYRKVNPAESPILYLALTSPTLPLSTVDEYGETLLSERISMVNGVAEVEVFGAQKYAVRVQLDPNALASRGIGINQVRTAIADANVNLPTGTLYGANRAFTVQATGQLEDAAAYRPLIVAYRNGSPVRLDELGHVIDSVQNDKTASWYNGTRGVILAILRQPGTNTVEVVNSIRNLLPTFRLQIPRSVSLDVVYDRSESIRASVDDVEFTLLLTVCLVVMVIFLFLRNISATIIPSLALPMSIIGTFAAMYLLGYTLDNLSLMALVLSVGFVVDDAIVILENIVRHMEMGKGPMQAALEGSREISFTILSMTLSLAAVFIPVLFMGGIVGRLFHEFAVTIAVAILISGFVSLTLTPMLCSRFLRPPGERRHGVLYRALERGFNGVQSAYDWMLRKVLRARPAVLALSLILLAITGYLFVVVPKGFLPSEDTGQIFGVTEGAQDISYDAMVAHQKEIDAIIRRDPYVSSYVSSVNRGTLNNGFVFMRLTPSGQRPGAQQIIEELRPKLAAVPGMRVFLQVPPLIRIGGQLTKSLYQFTLQDTDSKELYHWAPIIESKVRALPGLEDVTSDLQIKSPQIIVTIHRNKASTYGVTPQQIEDALGDAYGSEEVSTIYTPSNEYWVIMELEPRYQRDPAALSLLYISSSTGKLVPLSAVATLTPGVGPLTVSHFDQLPSVTISFNLQPGVALGQAVSDVQNTIQSMHLPATITTSFQGTAQAFQSSLRGLGILLIAAILVIYMILGILYESFIHPITILSGLPSAGLGALATLMLFHDELNVYSFVGVIMLVGIVKKNAIMMIDFAIAAERNEGKTPADAIYEACLIRFRPIIMTSMAALIGTLPLAIGFGAGGDARRPLGLAVEGGLVVSQLLTLFITPVYYVYLDRLQQFLGRHKRKRGGATPLPEPKPV